VSGCKRSSAIDKINVSNQSISAPSTTSIDPALSPIYDEDAELHGAGFMNGGMEITFSSHDRRSVASLAVQKSTVGVLSHTSQIVQIVHILPRCARGHRPPSTPPTEPPNPSSASPPAGSSCGGASGSSGERGARGREGSGYIGG
jgi:hypothetical protein